jgi:uncharacterized protein (DUF433 family)
MKKTRMTPKCVDVSDYIVADPEILGGDPVFRGTRVPIASLFEHLASDGLLNEFLKNYPTVTRATAVAVLVGAQELAARNANKPTA